MRKEEEEKLDLNLNLIPDSTLEEEGYSNE